MNLFKLFFFVFLSSLSRFLIFSSSELSPSSTIYISTGVVGLFVCSIAHQILKVLETDFYIQVLTTITLEVIQLPAMFFYVLSLGWVCCFLLIFCVFEARVSDIFVVCWLCFGCTCWSCLQIYNVVVVLLIMHCHVMWWCPLFCCWIRRPQDV